MRLAHTRRIADCEIAQNSVKHFFMENAKAKPGRPILHAADVRGSEGPYAEKTRQVGNERQYGRLRPFQGYQANLAESG